jgi:carbonic anhydrase
MAEHTCEAVVVHCIDFRLQQILNDWLTERFGVRNYDRISWAGGIKDFIYLKNQIDISRRLHKIRKIVLVNHEDCGAYGPSGTAERMLKIQYLDAQVEKYYLHLNGEFERIP